MLIKMYDTHMLPKIWKKKETAEKHAKRWAPPLPKILLEAFASKCLIIRKNKVFKEGYVAVCREEPLTKNDISIRILDYMYWWQYPVALLNECAVCFFPSQ